MSLPLAAWRVTYAPGEWLALSGPTTLVVLRPAPERLTGEVNELWRSVAAAGSADALLRLVAEFGLDELPDLGAFFWDEDALHGLARGAVRIVDAETGETALEGEGAVTWREEHLGTERRLRIDLAPVADDAAQLPLVVGAATVSALQLSTAAADLVRFPVAAEPTVEDEVEPEPEPEVAFEPEPEFELEPELERFAPPLAPEIEEASLGPVAGIPVPGIPAVPGIPSPLGSSLSSPPAPSEPVSIPEALGEADDDLGGTIFSTGLAATHKPATESAAEPQVLAVPCANGHANAPGSRACRICRAAVDSSNPRLIRRPILAGVHSNRGDFADVVEGVIVGRGPDASRGPAGAYLMSVVSPSNDISRSHLLVTVRDWNVHVTDLNSTNGTTVLPVGEPPFTLRDGASVQVEIGTVLDLGDGVSVRIEPPRT